jgi:nucleoside-triphosphatase THEP1
VLILFSGPIGSGKTTICQQLVATARARDLSVGGVLTPPIIREGVKVGIEAVDLDSGERRTLARNDRDLGGTRVGRYSFDDRTMAWMLCRCQAALESDALAFVDEIGRLELNRGGGLAPLLPLLVRPRTGHTVVVVRDTLLDALAARVNLARPRVVAIDAASQIRALLFGADR